MNEVITAIAPGLLDLLAVVLTGIIAWAASMARAKWGIEIAAKHREALHYALYSAATLALKKELTGQKAVDLMLDYVRRSVPDAIGNLKATPDVLADLAKAKLDQVLAERDLDKQDAGLDALAQALKRAGAH